MSTRQTQMRLYQICFPTAPDAENVSPSAGEWLWEELCRFAGGCTVISDSSGLWRAPAAETIHEQIAMVLVLAPDKPESAGFFHQLATTLIEQLRQQEIYIHSLPVELIVATSQATQPSWPRAAD